MWEQSKRLRTGSLVALTPAHAPFKQVVRMGIVAARPLMGLLKDPPEIDIFFTDSEQIEVDPQMEFLLVESRSGFFEGSRHVLR